MPTTSPTTNRPPAATSASSVPLSRAAPRPQVPPSLGRTGSGHFAELLTRERDGKTSRGCGAALTADSRTAAAAHCIETARTNASNAQPSASPFPNDDRPVRSATTAADLGDDDRSLLAAFTPPPSVLAAPICTNPSGPAPAGGGLARAEAAALAERLVRSMRVGKVGRDGHEVRLRLAVGAQGDLEVRLRHQDGALTATFVADAASHADLERLEGAVRHELRERGIECENILVATR